MAATTNDEKLSSIAAQNNLSVEEVLKLVNYDKQKTSHELTDIVTWFEQNPGTVQGRMADYNLVNPSAAIKPGAARRKKLLLIVAAVLVVLAGGYLAYKKFKK